MTPNETIGYFVGYMQKLAEKDSVRLDGTEGGAMTDAAVATADAKDQSQGNDKSIKRSGLSGVPPRSTQTAPQPAPVGDFWNTPDTMRGN